MTIVNLDMDLTYMPTIEGPPMTKEQMYSQACANDKTTVEAWRKAWVDQYKANHQKHGPFRDKSAAQFHKLYYQKPCIVAGSGPSLKRNAPLLADRKGVPLISCLHNFAYFEDLGIVPEFYLTLDSGKIVLDDVTHLGEKDAQYYWDRTEGKKLLAYAATYPEVLDKWKGEIYFYNSIIPDESIINEQEAVEKFRFFFSTGGNALGACVYAAKIVCGANPIMYVGADFSFDYTKRFHVKASDYDKPGHYQRVLDVFGNSVLTWPSYYNFKVWFDWLSCNVPGLYINCSEGGIMGAYPDGNIKQILQMPLAQALTMYSCADEVNVTVNGKVERKKLEEIFGNPETEFKFCMY